MRLINGDCLEIMRKVTPNSIDTIITDPPYGLSFMGKKWDYDVPSVEVWQEALRVLKPGGTALIFAGSRTQHRMAVNVEDAGFILKDCIMYLYGSGFPKATDITKQLIKKCKCGIMVEYEKETEQDTKYYLRPLREIDLQETKHIKDEQRKVLLQELQEQELSSKDSSKRLLFVSEGEGKPSLEGWCNILQKEGELYRCALCKMPRKVFTNGEKRWVHYGTQISNGETSKETLNKSRGCSSHRSQSEQQQHREPCSICKQFFAQETRNWNGWKSHGLKPAYEPILVAVKPNDGSYAQNALKWGVSGLNIDGGRVEVDQSEKESFAKEWDRDQSKSADKSYSGKYKDIDLSERRPQGRFPANIILDEQAGKMLDEQSGILKTGGVKKEVDNGANQPINLGGGYTAERKASSGGASRFFYCAKASKSERNAGCENLPAKQKVFNGQSGESSKELKDVEERFTTKPTSNFHPTVKPLKLMEYLCTLTKTPTGGKVLDPFMGSGTTGIACKNTGRDFVGIELDKEYFEIAKARIVELNAPDGAERGEDEK